MRGTIGLAFALLVILMLLAYYKGLQGDLSAVQALGTSWSYALTGRNQSGVFQSYPGGVTGTTGVTQPA